MSRIQCSFDSCPNSSVARGLCWKHYMRERRWGKASITKRSYRGTHRCRVCGETDPEQFYAHYKAICKVCKKLNRLIREGVLIRK